MILAKEYAERRNKVFDAMDNNSIAILFAGKGKKVSGDEFNFSVNRNFYYLTGIEQENSILALIKNDIGCTAYLFIDEKDEKIEKWIGYKLTQDEAKEISGIENICLRSTFDGKMISLADHNKDLSKFYLDLEPELKIGDQTSTLNYKKELETVYQVPVEDIGAKVYELRMIKSPAEVDMIREAINTTSLGLKRVLIELKAGKYEYNIRNVFEHAVFDENNSKLAFDSIVAGGRNAIVLHYPFAKDKLNEGELVLLDVGAANHYYCGDISRTYPISGRFSDIQRTIYNIVLQCNIETAKFMRPGITLKEANEFAKNFLASECFEKGLIHSKDEIGNVYYHSVSHHLGLDTHDGTDRVSKLVPGNVVTCEPGLYFKDLKIGVRIEDDILITEDGSEVLSSGIIKDIKDIETALETK